jgi:WD40 repeat protein
VKYTYDGTYLVSGSDDTNLRLWKSKASEQLGVVSFFNLFNVLKLLLFFGMLVACCCLESSRNLVVSYFGQDSVWFLTVDAL